MKKLSTILVYALLVISVLLSAFSIFFLATRLPEIQAQLDSRLAERFAQYVKDQKIATDGKDGYTPIKGVDYFDGIKGDDGLQGIRGEQGVKGETGATGQTGTTGEKGLQGEPGKLIILRCNTKKNRWEYKYEGDDTWQILNDEKVACTPYPTP